MQNLKAIDSILSVPATVHLTGARLLEPYWKSFGLLPPRVQPKSARLNFGSKLVALVANWAGFADSAD